MSAANKGLALEQAVAAIEAAILRSSPSLRENTFRIESRKVVVVDGVRHELDIYVEVDLGTGYTAKFIFECKNWAGVVGKNEIIIFAEKIDAIGAQKGFFVAKSFSKDAEAQAKKDRRIELLVAAEHNPETTPVPFNFHLIAVEPGSLQIDADLGGRQRLSSGPTNRFGFMQGKAFLGGVVIDIKKYVEEWVEELVDRNLNQFPSDKMPAGRYERSVKDERTFTKEFLLVDGRDINSIKVKAKFFVGVFRPPIVSHFEVGHRGRSLAFAPIDVYGETIQYDMILSGQERQTVTFNLKKP